MTNDNTKVSRLEFYHALSIVWLFISFAFGVRFSSPHGFDVVLYFLVSLILMAVYSISSIKLWRSRPRRSADA